MGKDKGSSPGSLTTGDLAFGDGAVFRWELDSAGQSDTVTVNGTLTFSGAATLELVDLGGTPAPALPYVLFSYNPTENDPAGPVWTIGNSLAPAWDTAAARIEVDALNDRVILTGLLRSFVTGDTNGDLRVDIDDLNAVRNNFGATGPNDGTLAGDVFPFDGSVNIDDLNAVRNNFGAAPNAVPEPAAGLLLLLAAAMPAIGRRAGSAGAALTIGL